MSLSNIMQGSKANQCYWKKQKLYEKMVTENHEELKEIGVLKEED
ncbi:MAG: hypothetical protein AABY22_26490 [Nanoarchaeota archaeon]